MWPVCFNQTKTILDHISKLLRIILKISTITKHYFAISIISIFVVACSKPELDSLIKDDSFTSDRLALGHLLISTPVVKNETGNKNLSRLNSSSFRRITGNIVKYTRDEREELKTTPLYAHRKYKPAHFELIKKIATAVEVNKSDIDALSKVYLKFPNPHRFIFVPILLSEENWQDYDQYETSDTKGEGENQKTTYYDNFVYKVSRRVDVRGIVIDLKFGTVVWDGLKSQTVADQNKITRKVRNTSAITINFGGNSTKQTGNQAPRDAYPKIPSVELAASRASYALIENLPEED